MVITNYAGHSLSSVPVGVQTYIENHPCMKFVCLSWTLCPLWSTFNLISYTLLEYFQGSRCCTMSVLSVKWLKFNRELLLHICFWRRWILRYFHVNMGQISWKNALKDTAVWVWVLSQCLIWISKEGNYCSFSNGAVVINSRRRCLCRYLTPQLI